MTRREYFHQTIFLNLPNLKTKKDWSSFYTEVYLKNTHQIINHSLIKQTEIKFYNFALKHSLSFLKNNLFDIRNNKIIPMIDCKNYICATAQNPEKFGELI